MDLDDGLDFAHSMFAGDIKLREMVDTTPQRPWDTGEMSQQESHEFQQREMPSPAHG